MLTLKLCCIDVASRSLQCLVSNKNCFLIGMSSNMQNAKRMLTFCLQFEHEEQKGVFCMLHVRIKTVTTSAKNPVLLKFLCSHELMSPQVRMQIPFFQQKKFKQKCCVFKVFKMFFQQQIFKQKCAFLKFLNCFSDRHELELSKCKTNADNLPLIWALGAKRCFLHVARANQNCDH